MSEHVIRRGARYYYRRRVPTDLLPLFEGKKELQRALGTSDPKEAAIAARRVAVEIDNLFESSRAESREIDPLADTGSTWNPDRKIGPLTHEESTAWNRAVSDEAERDPYVASLLAEDARRERKLERRRRVDERIAEAVERGIRRYTQTVEQTPHTPPADSATPAPAKSNDTAVGLADALQAWQKARSPVGSTLTATHLVVSSFWECCGKLPVKKIQREHIVQFQNSLKASGSQPGTVKSKLALLSALLGISVDEGWIKSNPAIGVKTSGQKNAKTARLPFTVTEINKIFESLPASGAKYWLPVIGLYTGLRLEEIGQLSASDIVREHYRDSEGKDKSVYVIYATDDGEDKRLKNEASRRRVPVSKTLIDLGFIEYAQGHTGRLFPELKPDKNGRKTAIFSTWFGRVKRGLGITDSRKAFHSYRHVFKDVMREMGVAEDVSDALSGHSNGSVSRNYGSGFYPLRPLVEAMERYEIHGVTLPAAHVRR